MALLETVPSLQQRTRPSGLDVAGRLLAWRNAPGFGWAEGTALALYFSIAAYALRYHEPWDDEAQAWLIARDNSVWQILRYRLHYEGAPAAWPLLMHAFHWFGGTYAGLGWLSVVIATLGIYVWLRWSPFPPLLRFLLPFTFFLQYQYAIIARSYVLFPPLTFALCALYTRRRKVIWFAVAAGLLANLSLQGFLMAIAFVGLYLFDSYKVGAVVVTRASKWYRLSAYRISAPRKYVTAAVLLAAMSGAAIYCAIPAPDLDFAIGDQVSDGWVHHVLLTIVGETPRNAPRPAPEPPVVAPIEEWPTPHWNTEPREWLAAMIYPRTPPENHYAMHWFFRTFGPVVLDFLNVAAWPIAGSNLLASAFLVALVLWLKAHRRLRMMWLWLAVIASGKILWIAEHHAGMLLIALVAGVWLAVDTGGNEVAVPRLDRTFLTLFAAVLLLQIGWSIYCIRADVKGSYDPGPETAQWLKQHASPRMAAFGFPTVSIQPYFSRSPFFDVSTSWWQWSSNVEVDGIHRRIIASDPGAVVYGVELPGYDQIRDQWLPVNHFSPHEERFLPHDPLIKDLHDHGYLETHRFCGARFARFGSSYRICDLVFEPSR